MTSAGIPKLLPGLTFYDDTGDTVHLPTPKNVCSRHLELNKDTPFFAPSDAPLVLIKGGAIDSTNSRMMNVRWRFYHFWNQKQPEEQQELIPCGRCFAKFILDNARNEALLKRHGDISQ